MKTINQCKRSPNRGCRFFIFLKMRKTLRAGFVDCCLQKAGKKALDGEYLQDNSTIS